MGQRSAWAPGRQVAWVPGCCTGEAHACCPLVAALPHCTPSGARKHVGPGSSLIMQRFDAAEDLLRARDCSGCWDPYTSFLIMVLIELSDEDGEIHGKCRERVRC